MFDRIESIQYLLGIKLFECQNDGRKSTETTRIDLAAVKYILITHLHYEYIRSRNFDTEIPEKHQKLNQWLEHKHKRTKYLG